MSDRQLWRKSTYSGGEGGSCVEVAESPGVRLVRDSKNPDGAWLSFPLETWSAFTEDIRNGQFG